MREKMHAAHLQQKGSELRDQKQGLKGFASFHNSSHLGEVEQEHFNADNWLILLNNFPL